MTDSNSPSIPAYQKLKTLRSLLLKLHKALLDAERDSYERIHGPIPSKGELFQLVIGDEWFEWLRPISQFIVKMDEALGEKDLISPNQIYTLLAEARDLLPLQVTDTSEAAVRYQRAKQNDAAIASMHVEMVSLLDLTPTGENQNP
ncbi:MAG: hypothetical protein F6J95_032985 [Leptolyngbya sp. SIO1E4]|nr:hypothetical protein [Leptolyngbya sp. SIO1E4]